MNSSVDRAVRAASRWFLAEYPRWEVERVVRVAHEPNRDVLHVWYRRDLPSRPAPYKVVAVDRETQAVCELDVRTYPEYAARGHK